MTTEASSVSTEPTGDIIGEDVEDYEEENEEMFMNLAKM